MKWLTFASMDVFATFAFHDNMACLNILLLFFFLHHLSLSPLSPEIPRDLCVASGGRSVRGSHVWLLKLTIHTVHCMVETHYGHESTTHTLSPRLSPTMRNLYEEVIHFRVFCENTQFLVFCYDYIYLFIKLLFFCYKGIGKSGRKFKNTILKYLLSLAIYRSN